MAHRLIILVGTAPAVITETVYSLWHEWKQRTKTKGKVYPYDGPDEVIAITTEIGRAEIKRQLLDSGIWKQMLDDIGVHIKFGDNSRNIRCIPTPDGDCNSADIVTGEDNKTMADFFLSELRSHTEEPGVKLSFSVSGGRKTMSAIGALVMSLLARREDRLLHILVKPPFDNPKLEPPFYYPVERQAYRYQGKAYRAEDAGMQLSDIPFVRCRYWFEEKLNSIPNYADLVARINHLKVNIRVDADNKNVNINGKDIKLPYLLFLLYWMFAELHKKHCGTNDTRYLINKDDLGHAFIEFLNDKGIKIKSGKQGQGHSDKLAVYEDNLGCNNLYKRISDIQTKLKAVFDGYNLTPAEMGRFELNRGGRFGISSLIDADCIEIVE